MDYNPRSAESVAFFKMVQNKLHYAAHGHTAAEVIYERADADKPFMGLTTFSGDFPTAKDIGIEQPKTRCESKDRCRSGRLLPYQG